MPEATAESDNAAQLLLAETLYREGRRLAAEHRYDEAAAKLIREALRILVGIGERNGSDVIAGENVGHGRVQ